MAKAISTADSAARPVPIIVEPICLHRPGVVAPFHARTAA